MKGQKTIDVLTQVRTKDGDAYLDICHMLTIQEKQYFLGYTHAIDDLNNFKHDLSLASSELDRIKLEMYNNDVYMIQDRLISHAKYILTNFLNNHKKEGESTMMDLAINGGTMKITDDNKTIVSQDVAEEINANIEESDANKTKKPDLIIAED